MGLDNVKQVAQHYGNLIVERAQLELGTRRSMKSGRGRAYTGRKVATDTLRKNLNVILSAQKGKFILKFGAKGAASKYAYYVHEGRSKGKRPPIHELVEWLRRKGIRPRNKETGAFEKSTEKKLEGIAYVIARSIGKYGIPEFPYYRMAFKKYDTEMSDALLDAVVEDVNIVFDKEGI
jgi:hypothetical protein